MNAPALPPDQARLARLTETYFAAVDRMDLAATLACFTPDARFTIATYDTPYQGRDTELRGMFDGTRTADETAGKPHPLMLQQLMREFGVEPERTLMIGDTTHDLQLAINAGTASVGVSYGAHEPASFESLGPLFVAQSTAQLHEWLLVNG